MEHRTLDSCGKERKTEIPQRSEEAQVPPLGKRVNVAQWNERIETNQRDGTASVRLLEAIILLCPKLFFIFCNFIM
ncbi:hypothetical protein [Priestia flexa]|uniref:hypothetical protein n=1 Tax=Priestia flexa TaxID=86664 RepID=UPI000953D175|nr:hypothetical protein [Priestia flexa]MBY6085715.1 hypothetical protein [Priestia flexa]SIQ12609.1 hypothetical protein SAMN05880580_10321 [Priestia flexa]